MLTAVPYWLAFPIALVVGWATEAVIRGFGRWCSTLANKPGIGVFVAAPG